MNMSMQCRLVRALRCATTASFLAAGVEGFRHITFPNLSAPTLRTPSARPQPSKHANAERSPSALNRSTMTFRSKSRTTELVSRYSSARASSSPSLQPSRLERAPARGSPFATTSLSKNITEKFGSIPNWIRERDVPSESHSSSFPTGDPQ